MPMRQLLVSFGMLASLAVLAGCDGKGTGKAGDSKTKTKEEHPSVGPHKGAIAEWGDEDYHVEFTVDHKTKEATVYILGPDVKTAKPIPTKEISVTLKDPAVTFTLQAVPEKSDSDGKSSRFVGKHEALGTEKDFEGSISGNVGKEPYSGDFKEKDGAEHSHKK